MRRIVTAILFILFSNQAIAVDCSGIPSTVKMGEYGSQEGYIIVHINGFDYRLGVPSDDSAKARLSLAQTALVTSKSLLLRYWAVDSCDMASTNRVVPNSVQLLK